MENLDIHFDNLDTFIEKKETDKDEMMKCCDRKENYLNDEGIIRCKKCQNIISNISFNPEWRNYDNKTNDPTRCGMPVNTLLPESSVGSTVSYKKCNKTMNQIRKYQQWNGMPYKERSLYKVFLEIQGKCSKHNIPNVIITEAKSLYKIISSTKISRGSNRTGIIAACVYFACKKCNVPRSSKEIAEIFDITSNVMTKGVKKAQEIIAMNKINKQRLTQSPSTKPDDFIERFCDRLKISLDDIKIIQTICNITIDNNLISENTPPSIAAGCIFFYSKNKEINITKKDISDVSKTSEVTINKCSKKLEVNKELFRKIID